MSKQNLINTIAEQTSTSKAEAQRTLEAVLQAIHTELSNGNEVRIVGFGNFKVQHRPARDARDPQSGNQIRLEAKNVVKFKAGVKLLKGVN